MYQGKYSKQSDKKRPITAGTIVFYGILLVLILAFVVGLNKGLTALNDWLVEFEASQSTHKSTEVFEELFAQPDWKQLYEMTGQQDTTYEGAQAYADFMAQKLGSGKLTMAKTSAGLDTTREKYLVKLDKETVADFTLVNRAAADAQIAQWELDSVSIYYERKLSIQIVTQPGHTVYVNGVALGDGHITSTSTTLAEEYLPEGLVGFRQQTLALSGLLVAPTVTIQDENGQQLQVHADPQNLIYTEVVTAAEPSEEVKQLAVEAAQSFARFMLAKESEANLAKYYDKNNSAYQTAIKAKEQGLWVQANKGFVFSEPVITDFYQYSESLYSIRVALTTTVTRTDDTTKDYEMDTTYFFAPMADGTWKVTEKTNEQLQTQFTQVRLDFIADGELLHTEFVDSKASKLTLPGVNIPEGKTFLGWFTKTTDENGNIKLQLAFAPSQDGTVHLSPDTELQPMELYAQFE